MTQPRKYILTVLHNIFLTKKERYELVNGKTVEAIGVSVPVWICKDDSIGKGYTSEPAIEVFCKYIITNKTNKAPIHKIEGGYQINLPQLPSDYVSPKRVSDNTWRNMTREQQARWYEENKTPDTANNLRDTSDGGSCCIRFEEYNMEKAEDRFVTLGHYVKIDSIDSLEKTIERDVI